MARKRDLCRAADGQFVRNLGWKRTPNGYTQAKFRLGRDQDAAKLASLRLERLWDEVTARWQRAQPERRAATQRRRQPVVESGFCWGPDGRPGVIKSVTRFGDLDSGDSVDDDRPVWDVTTLEIADAVRRGEAVALVSIPKELSIFKVESGVLGVWLHELQRELTVIKIELEPQLQANVNEVDLREGRRLVDMGNRLLRKPGAAATLHRALSAYGESIKKKALTSDGKLSPWGGTQLRQVAFLKRHLTDRPLDEFDTRSIDDCLDVMRSRPATKKTNKQSSKSWIANCLKQFNHFLRWLAKTPQFGWSRPADLEVEPVRIPLSPSEKSAKGRGVKRFTLEQLKTIWKYAPPHQRLRFLIGLNFGFGAAEVASLEVRDVYFGRPHPRADELGQAATCDTGWVVRSRPKSGVYGEWKMWPVTAKALAWWLRQREKIKAAASAETLLVTRTGQRFDAPTKSNHANQQIRNAWNRLVTKISDDDPTFPKLSFKYLRKTAATLIRQVSHGEIAGIFLCHGKPVATDNLIDVYAERPFEKVFEAIDLVDAKLQEVWSSVPDPFPEEPKKGGTNISPAKIEQIRKMKAQGYRLNAIAEQLGISITTVRRWAIERKQ